MDSSTLMEKLLGKAKEAFTLAIEIYNKPSIRYRVEGFSFFICNAWELMLKAHIAKTKGEDEIYHKDNPDRTISLENCVKLIFTNEYSPVRKNLSRIIELRNTSTHFIVEEYEMVYIPLFQACVFNFIEKMAEYHDVDMTSIIPQNFLTLAVSMQGLNEAAIRAKYPGQIAEKLLAANAEIGAEIAASNSDFAIRIEHYHYMTKDQSKATEIFSIAKDAPGVQIIKELKDPNDSFKYTAKKCIKEINNRLSRGKICLMNDGEPVVFNMYHFGLFTKYYGMKENTRFCYPYKVNTPTKYGYSIQAIDFIVEEIKKDPEHIVQNLKEHLTKKKS